MTRLFQMSFLALCCSYRTSAEPSFAQKDSCISSSSSSTIDQTTTSSTTTSAERQLLCRHYPTWSGHLTSTINRTQCIEATDYDPDQYDLLPQGIPDEYVEHFGFAWMQRMVLCVDDAMRSRHYNETLRQEPTFEPTITNMYPNRENPVMATVSFALSEEEAATVLDLAKCVRRYHYENQFKHRSFGYSEDDDFVESQDDDVQGGNDVTFLGGFLQLFLPGVAAQIIRVGEMVWEAAGWSDIPEYPGIENQEFPFQASPRELGIRTSEHLSYEGWGELGPHADSSSLYTILVSLVDPDEYEGGEFSIFLEDSDQHEISIKPERLSAIVFLSEEMHGVKPIQGGRREMFATELWEYGDAPLGEQRPVPIVYKEYVRTGVWPNERMMEEGLYDWNLDEDEDEGEYSESL